MDINAYTTFKWMASENSSSKETCKLGKKTREALGLSPRDYRKLLSWGRNECSVLERLMSDKRYDEIEFDKIPSRAGLLYRNAFYRNEATKDRYEAFAKDKKSKVNAGTLYPYDVVREAIRVMNSHCSLWGGYEPLVPATDEVDRLMVNKYWDSLTNYFDNAALNALVVCDTSASMLSGGGNIAPIDIAVSLAIYAAEKAKGPFANHYISFSRQAKLVEVRGIDFCDKVDRIVRSNVCQDTNLQSVFELLINTVKNYSLMPDDMPRSLVVISDQEINACSYDYSNDKLATTMDNIRNNWYNQLGYQFPFPEMVYWNVNSKSSTFIDDAKSGVSFVSGASPVLFELIMSGKNGISMMFEKLNSSRYASII